MKPLFWYALVVFVAALLLRPVLKPSKEGYVDYVVVGPRFWGPRPPVDYASGPWWWHERPYWHRRWRFGGPCPGPWCPY